MSRVGKMGIKLEDKVKATIASGAINFEGPKGKLTVKLPSSEIKAEVKDGVLSFTRPSDSRQHRALLPTCRDAVHLFACRCGIFLDYVYTGKAGAGVLDYLNQGRFPPGSAVLFLHTGGNVELFA